MMLRPSFRTPHLFIAVGLLFAGALMSGCEDPCDGARQIIQQAQVLQSDRDLQVETYLKAFDKCPAVAEDTLFVGMRALQQGQLEDAEAIFRAVTKFEGASQTAQIDATIGYAMLNEQRGRPQRSVTLLQQALSVRPNDGNIIMMLAETHETVGNVEAAIEHFEAARNAGISPAEVEFRLGRLFILQNDFGQALVHFREAMQLEPNRGEIPAQIGDILLSQGNTGEAKQMFEKAAQLNPRIGLAHQKLGEIAIMNRQPMQAVQHYQMLGQVQPRSQDAFFGIAWSLFLAERYEEAYQFGVQGLQMGYNNEKLRDTVGQIAAELGKKEEALQLFTELIQSRPADPWTNYGLGKTYLLFNNQEEARKYLQKAADLNDEGDADPYLAEKLMLTGVPLMVQEETLDGGE